MFVHEFYSNLKIIFKKLLEAKLNSAVLVLRTITRCAVNSHEHLDAKNYSM